MAVNIPAATFTTYIPPTTPPLTQFTPAPTCYPKTSGEQMWHVTGLCYPYARNGNPNSVPLPQCTYTRAGNPEENKAECGNRWGGPGIDQGVIGSCPVGFTSAGVDNGYPSNPFDRTFWFPTLTSQIFDVTATAVICCPSVEGLDFKARSTGNVYTETSTFHSGVWFDMYVPVPYCYAHPATALDGKTVTMGVYHDSRVFDRKKKREVGSSQEESLNKRQDWPWDAPGFGWGDVGQTTTAVFNARHDTIWAEEVRYYYTVFHKTHTCYEKCAEYFSSSYYNTDPNFTPPPPTMTPTTTPPAVSPHPSSGFPHSSGFGGSGRPPYPSSSSRGSGAPFPTSSGGGGGKDDGGHAGNKPPVYTGKPPLQNNFTGPVQSEAPGVRLGSLAVLSTLAVGFLGLTLAL
ncbi:hypothetical protein QBC37DRAFT_35681 [Rhypophila decipiens]|uniref:Uncharacterized protein n=1 Tax=Rhypophila decipiens TaxID=261697 RepID=A0AAN6Y319_9PEZI|nr:hypothetical protein QBC37DRAFT_35681 [Rhypophila decipiens]